MKSEKKLTAFLDGIGRTIIAELVSDEEKFLRVKNPAIVNIVPQQVQGPNGQMIQRMSLQLFPLFFREFLADKDANVTFKYPKDLIVVTDEPIDFEFKLNAQYEQLFMPAIGNVNMSQPAGAPPAAPAPNNDNTIKLFDD